MNENSDRELIGNMEEKQNKLINKVKGLKSVVKLRSFFGKDALDTFYKEFPEIKDHINYLLKGSFILKTDPPYNKSIKFNFNIVDFFIETEDEYVDIYLHIDLLTPKNLSDEDQVFVVNWVRSYLLDESIGDVKTNDSYFDGRDVWIEIKKINGKYIDTSGEESYSSQPPSDIKLFNLFNIPYENIN